VTLPTVQRTNKEGKPIVEYLDKDVQVRMGDGCALLPRQSRGGDDSLQATGAFLSRAALVETRSRPA